MAQHFSDLEPEKKAKFLGSPVDFFKFLDEIIEIYNSPVEFPLDMSCSVMQNLMDLKKTASKMRMTKNCRNKNDLFILLSTTLETIKGLATPKIRRLLKNETITLQPFSSRAPEKSLKKFVEGQNQCGSDFKTQQEILRRMSRWYLGLYKVDSARVIKVNLEGPIPLSEVKNCYPKPLDYADHRSRILTFFFAYVAELELQDKLKSYFQQSIRFNLRFFEGKAPPSLLLVAFILTRFIGLIEIPSGYCWFENLGLIIQQLCSGNQSITELTHYLSRILVLGKQEHNRRRKKERQAGI